MVHPGGVIVIVRASHAAMPLWLTIGGAAGFGLVMWFVARPLFRGLERVYQQRGKMTQNLLALILLLVFASAWLTETLGIHALFGAFVAGAVMPKGSEFVKALTERLEDIVVVLFLPLFFAFTGLRMTIGG
jgi:Kef-type K+ transport system membrane component KefB